MGNVPATAPNWSVSIAVWVVTVVLDVCVVLWSSTWQLRLYECESYFFPSVMLVLIMIGLPTAYALWRCALHHRAEPNRHVMIRRVTTGNALVGAGSIVAGIIVLSVSNTVGRC
jgi:flagellar biosynthesis component FlhA